jgi:hypothetical protein
MKSHLFVLVFLQGMLAGIVVGQGKVAELPQVKLINQAMETSWKENELVPSPEAAPGIWLRRVYLDLIGRIPSLEELNEFEADKSPDKKAKIVDRLLESDRYTEEFAGHWGTIWCNLLIGRSGGTERDSLVSRDGMLKYLRDAFANNVTYDRMVFDLVSATGSTKPGTPNFHGAVNYLADKVNEEKGTLATSSVSRLFLGLQVQCTQCHNHPFNQWKQEKFWEFNAFFRQTRALRRFVSGTRDIDHAELVDEDFAGEAGNAADAVVFYELRNGITKAAYPVFIDGQSIPPSGYVEETNRRKALAEMVVASPYLAKTIVNRMFAHFLGYGFTRPIDDLGEHNPASDPELLEKLAQEFRNRSHDLRQLMRWIILSKPYQLSSELTAGSKGDDPTVGEPPRFARFYLRQMSAEQLYQSLVTSSGAMARGSYEEQERVRRDWMRQFVVAFGTDEGDEATTFNGSIPQALMLFNGDLVQKATKASDGQMLKRLIAAPRLKTNEKVRDLFLAGLGRRPTNDEIKMAGKLYLARKNSEAEMLEDLWWAILNSNEFILVH